MDPQGHIPNLRHFLQDVYVRQSGTGTSATSVTSDSVSAMIAAGTTGLGSPADIDRLSNAISILSQQVSILSQQTSVHSQAISVLSQQVSVLSQQVSVLSQQVSVLSQQVSVISAGLGGVQLKVVGDVQGISATALTNISGLSASVASTAVYQIETKVLYRMSVADTVGFGLTFPVGTVAGIRVTGTSAVGQGPGVGAFANEDGSGSIIYSVIPAAAFSTNIVEVNAVFQVSITAGIVQLQARVSATANPVNIQRGSYLRAYKLL